MSDVDHTPVLYAALMIERAGHSVRKVERQITDEWRITVIPRDFLTELTLVVNLIQLEEWDAERLATSLKNAIEKEISRARTRSS